ncbi:MAG: type II toxin-antitoxin system RelE/ParE family toxin [Planctomycetaceae bacterium]|nr:type II toxin-antitoxin system RelE/ParE family toxin [Planctomycetaceae bacterium]
MSYALIVSPAAARDLKKLKKSISKADLLRIDEVILSLADNPRRSGAEKLTDVDAYRIRSGNFRVLFSIDDNEQAVTIEAVKDRKDAYR